MGRQSWIICMRPTSSQRFLSEGGRRGREGDVKVQREDSDAIDVFEVGGGGHEPRNADGL